MTKLTDSQLILLSRASQQDDGLLKDAGTMNAGAAAKVAGALIRRKLMWEVRSKQGMPVWRQDEDGRNLSLVITKAGRKAIHVEDSGDEENDSGYRSSAAQHDGRESRKPARASRSTDGAPTKRPAGKSTSKSKDASDPESTIRPGSKLALIIEMLQRPGGATVSDMMETTGWRPHSTRAALTGLRKRGFDIGKTQTKDEPTVYRINTAAVGGKPALAA